MHSLVKHMSKVKLFLRPDPAVIQTVLSSSTGNDTILKVGRTVPVVVVVVLIQIHCCP